MATAIILAAGDSVRMKAVKPLMPWNGLPFIEHVCRALRQAGIRRRIAVLGRRHKEILQAWQPQGEHIAINPKPEDGQLSSLRAGLAYMTANPAIFGGDNAGGIMICLADQPLIKAETYSAVWRCAKNNPGSIIIPRVPRPNRQPDDPPYKRGHPIIIPQNLVHLCLEGPLDKGLHWATHHPAAKVLDLDVADPAIIRDFDTPEAYQALLAEFGVSGNKS